MKNLLLFFFAIALSSPLFSQQITTSSSGEPRQKFSLGVLGGLTINSMPFYPAPKFEGVSLNKRLEPEYGYFAGVSARQPISKRFAAKMDVQYAVKGYGVKDAYATPFSLEHYRLSSLDIAPQVEYKVFKNIYFSLGGYGGIRLEERIKYPKQDWKKLDPDFLKLSEDVDWGLVTGLRVEFGRFSALVKYQHGLTPAIKLELQDYSGIIISDGRQYHRTVEIGLGCRLF